MDSAPLASRLLGKKLGKWEVVEKRKKNEDDNSGFFSTCYTVRDDVGNLAFLKDYNYFYAFQSYAGSADALKLMTENFTYERDLLLFCAENKMKRVVSAIGSGEYIEKGESVPVPYLIFEIAQGSLKTTKIIENPSFSFKLLAFHGALVGLHQLHKAKIVHQDIKPSNILIFGENYSKISDLGSATQFNHKSNWETENHCGDQRYAPIELLYGYSSPNWEARRYGADLFMMGGLLTYMLTGSNLLSLMLSKIPDSHSHINYGGTFEEVKPYLMNSFYETLEEINYDMPYKIRDDLMTMISELSHPIPEERGKPRRLIRSYGQFSLQKYISMSDRLAKYAMWNKL